jgi:hypothetical protein
VPTSYEVFRNFTEPVVISSKVNVADRASGIIYRTLHDSMCLVRVLLEHRLLGSKVFRGFSRSILTDQCSGGATPASSKSFSIYHLPASHPTVRHYVLGSKEHRQITLDSLCIIIIINMLLLSQAISFCYFP